MLGMLDNTCLLWCKCRQSIEASLASLLASNLSKEASAAERMASLESGLAILAAAAAKAQSALADATNKGGWQVLRQGAWAEDVTECVAFACSGFHLFENSGSGRKQQPAAVFCVKAAGTGRRVVRIITAYLGSV